MCICLDIIAVLDRWTDGQTESVCNNIALCVLCMLIRAIKTTPRWTGGCPIGLFKSRASLTHTGAARDVRKCTRLARQGRGRGVAAGWTGRTFLPEGIPGIYADPLSFLGSEVGQVWSLIRFPTLIRRLACCPPHIFKPGDAAGQRRPTRIAGRRGGERVGVGGKLSSRRRRPRRDGWLTPRRQCRLRRRRRCCCCCFWLR